MSTQIQKAKIQPNLPAAVAESLSADALTMAKRIGAPSGDLVRIQRDKSFELPTGETTKELAVVVVGFVAVNKFYPGEYDAKDIKPPVCMAIGTVISEMKPFPQSPEVQDRLKGAPGGCHSCWANQWKSDNKKKGKACKNQRMLAFLAPEHQEEGPLLLINVSPTGIRYWDTYVNTVLTLTKYPPLSVVTRIFCDANSDWPSLRFEVQGPNPNIEAAAGRMTDAMARLTIEPDFAPAAPAVAEKK
jgi:hypothetical protein